MRTPLLIAALLLLSACDRNDGPDMRAMAPAAATPSSADEPERELDWLEMMPKEEVAAMERGDGPEVEHSGNRKMPQFGTFKTVDDVLRRPVRLPGYVVPLANSADGKLIEFLFVPYYGACIHVPPPPPNQIVHVVLSEPVPMPDIYAPFLLSGSLRAERLNDELAGSAYMMANPTLRPYEP
jgi:uncharacterized protein